jgi:hypothetical protein
MKIIVSIGVQFMMKDREMDMPSMLPRTTHDYPMSVEVSPELQPYISEYAQSVADPAYTPSYEISKVLIDIIKPRVKKAYPEHWRTETDSDGKKIKFVPTNETILETAIRMEIDDKIDELLDDRKDDVLKDLNLTLPKDDERQYLANTFVTNLGWKIA